MAMKALRQACKTVYPGSIPGVASKPFSDWQSRISADLDMDVVIHHNTGCGTSRNVLAIIHAAGYEPTIIEYLKTGWTRAQLLALFAAAGLTPRDALRETK